MLDLLLLLWLFSSCSKQGLLFFFFFIYFYLLEANYSIVVVFVIHWHESAMDLHVVPIPKTVQASVFAARGLWFQLLGSRAQAHWLWCKGPPTPCMWDLPRSGMELMSAALTARSFSTGPAGKPVSEALAVCKPESWHRLYSSQIFVLQLFKASAHIGIMTLTCFLVAKSPY